METQTILFITLIMSIITILILSFKKNTEKVIIPDITLYTEENKYFSKAVLDLLQDVVYNPQLYITKTCTFARTGQTIEVWMANEIHNRAFYSHEESDKEIVEARNKELTAYDKILLDKIGKAIEKNSSFPTYIKID